jgi:hypothetical protein
MKLFVWRLGGMVAGDFERDRDAVKRSMVNAEGSIEFVGHGRLADGTPMARVVASPRPMRY